MYPILLNASATLAAGTTATLDSGALQSPFRTPIIVDEIRFTAYGPPVTVNSANINRSLPTAGLLEMGGSIAARISIARRNMTNGFIPIWLFGPQVQAVPSSPGTDPSPYALGQIPESVVGYAIDQSGKHVTYVSYSWKLPKPLLLPAGTPLLVLLQRAADGMGGNAVVNCALIGRAVETGDAVPETNCVPYVTAFIPPESQAFAQSNEMDLGNPFQVPLYVQRFCGRVQYRSTSTQMMYDEGSTYMPDGVTWQTAAQVKMQMQHGPEIVRDYTPFYDVFDANRRAWTFSTVLQAKQRFDASISGVATHETPMISLVGYREEAL